MRRSESAEVRMRRACMVASGMSRPLRASRRAVGGRSTPAHVPGGRHNRTLPVHDFAGRFLRPNHPSSKHMLLPAKPGLRRERGAVQGSITANHGQHGTVVGVAPPRFREGRNALRTPAMGAVIRVIASPRGSSRRALCATRRHVSGAYAAGWTGVAFDHRNNRDRSPE